MQEQVRSAKRSSKNKYSTEYLIPAYNRAIRTLSSLSLADLRQPIPVLGVLSAEVNQDADTQDQSFLGSTAEYYLTILWIEKRFEASGIFFEDVNGLLLHETVCIDWPRSIRQFYGESIIRDRSFKIAFADMLDKHLQLHTKPITLTLDHDVVRKARRFGLIYSDGLYTDTVEIYRKALFKKGQPASNRLRQ